MTIAHTGIRVTPDVLAQVVAWYLEALAPLGYKKIVEIPGIAVGLGDKEHDPDWWIIPRDVPQAPGNHTAFVASDRTSVDAFYKAAIAAGGKDNGAPGIRERHSPNYYAAFVHDPVGNNIEVLCQVPQAE
ncbi:related to glyoxalase family protein [Cephalotrichum gorgonifer]|uniref:Related to glyoxalase family protein n=1 Tax=Cephalotrichum gorgonifer TaxID=2041049 RepID=A0AAE8N739_9PEZI|nr:related to glyoxalase family protein [Cephalotrichum gorgonifer]